MRKRLPLLVIQTVPDCADAARAQAHYRTTSLDKSSTVPDFCVNAKPVLSPTKDKTQVGWQLDPMNILNKLILRVFGRSTPTLWDVFLNTRSINGIDIAEKLRTRTCQLGGSYYHFAMTGAEAVPLGWTLSSYAQGQLEAILKTGRGAGLFERLVNELRSGEEKGQCQEAKEGPPAIQE
jgi:hypothetical protein